MLSTKDARIARKVKRRLLEVTPVQRVVVYGSRARGDATRYSDLDLYIAKRCGPPLAKEDSRDRLGGQFGFGRGYFNTGRR